MRFAFLASVGLFLFSGIGFAPGEPQQTGNTGKDQKKAVEKPVPLKLSDDPPLLLLGDDSGDTIETAADNSRCHVCHLNFAMEPIALIHAKNDIGCQKCHGACDNHIDDESWAIGGPGTAPNIMFPREAIDAACGKCHATHDVPATKVLERWQKRCPDKKDFEKIACTDCHGQHRLVAELRKAWWDKKTRKPIKNPLADQITPGGHK